MNLNAHSARVLFRSQQRTGGVSIGYRRGAEVIEIDAIAGRVNMNLLTNAGISVDAQERDFTLLAADLVIGGQRITPERGDQVELTGEDGQTEIFELLPLSGTDRVFAYGDPNRVLIRLHTKRIQVVAP